MTIRFALLFLALVIVLVPPASGQCVMTQVELAYIVTVQWWDGTTTFHWQLGWFDVYACSTDVYGNGGGGVPGGGGPGGGGPPDPTLEIRDISDANPGVPVLRISENDAVVETTVAYDGDVALTTGKTGSLFLNPLNTLDGDVTVTVQARNSAYIFATAICHIYRHYQGPFAGSVDVKAVWTKFVQRVSRSR